MCWVLHIQYYSYYPMMTPKEGHSKCSRHHTYLCNTGCKNWLLADSAGWGKPRTDHFPDSLGSLQVPQKPMGLSCAQNKYCRRGDIPLSGVPNVAKVMDDILVYSRTNQELLESVVKVLERYKENKITLNPKKFKFGEEEVDYVGYKIGKTGIRADPAKIEAISKFPTLTNLVELRSFMGLVNQLSKFSPDIAGTAKPLHGLLKIKNAYVWTPAQEEAFTAVKKALMGLPVLAPFNPELETMLQTSKRSRLHAVAEAWRVMEAHPVQFQGSWLTRRADMPSWSWSALEWSGPWRSVTSTFSVAPSTLVIDHKPLVPILDRYMLDMENQHLQRLKEKVSHYKFVTTWRKGKEHYLPDALSCAPISDPKAEDCLGEIEQGVKSVVRAVTVRGLSGEHAGLPDPYLEKIKAAAEEDTDYQSVIPRLLKRKVA